jgi:hypothetical protein
MASPRIELLYWAGCPSHPAALADLRLALAELGADPSAVEVREVHTEDDARAEGFVGSPTIRAAGADVQPPAPDEPTGLACRLYRRRDGRHSPVPDPDDLRDALRRVLDPRRPA